MISPKRQTQLACDRLWCHLQTSCNTLISFGSHRLAAAESISRDGRKIVYLMKEAGVCGGAFVERSAFWITDTWEPGFQSLPCRHKRSLVDPLDKELGYILLLSTQGYKCTREAMLGMTLGRTLRHSQRRGTLSLLCADQVELLLTGYPLTHFTSYVKL